MYKVQLCIIVGFESFIRKKALWEFSKRKKNVFDL